MGNQSPGPSEEPERASPGPSEEPERAFDVLLTLLLIGDCMVGKSRVLSQYVDGFTTDYTFPTIVGVDFKIKNIKLEGKRVKLLIWEAAGQERYDTMITDYFKTSMGIILVYDVTDQESFDNITTRWLQKIEMHAQPDAVQLLVGNKCDMDNRRKVPKERGKELATRLGIPFLEISAKTNHNIEETFETVVRLILIKIEKAIEDQKAATLRAMSRITTTFTPVSSSHASNINPSRFSLGDRVVLQSPDGSFVKGVIRWAGPMKTSLESGGSVIVPVVGIETLRPVNHEVEFPDLSYNVTDRELFTVFRNHGKIFVAEQTVLTEDEYIQKGAIAYDHILHSIGEIKRIISETSIKVGLSKEELKDTFDNLSRKTEGLIEGYQIVTTSVANLKSKLIGQKTKYENQIEEDKEKDVLQKTKYENQIKDDKEKHERLLEEYRQERTKLQEDFQRETSLREERDKKVDQLEEKLKQLEQSWKIKCEDITLTDEPKLGSGAWGGVAVGVFREQRVAVKQLHNLILGERTLAVMNREINTMSRLRHPNLLLFIGAVLDHPSAGNPLIITEIMDTSLRHAYEKGQLTNDETSKLSILRDTASGLNYLHCHHDEIIHRDVSSANVLLESRGTKKWRAKLSDFGSANIARQAFTQAPGAAVYSAPEILVALTDEEEQHPQTTKIDVYSYGILTCEVMCCQFPESPSVFRTMLARIRSSSPSIGEMIQACINKEPQRRPTMRQVINQIDGLF